MKTHCGIQTKRRNPRAGFSLAELMCALFVISAGLMGSLQMYMIAMDKTRAMHETAIAMQAILNEAETLRALPFRDITDGEHAFRSVTPEVERLKDAVCRARITGRGEAGVALKEVTVEIRWRGEHGRLIEKRIVTLIAEKGS